VDNRQHTYFVTVAASDTLAVGDSMSTIIERLRSRQRVNAGDGLAELLEEAAREIERLRVEVDDVTQRLNVERTYSSSDWPDDV